MQALAPVRAASARTVYVRFIVGLSALRWLGSEGEVESEQHRPIRRTADVRLRLLAVAVARVVAGLRVPPLVLREDERILRADVQACARRVHAAGPTLVERVAERDVADANERAVLVVARAGEGAKAGGARPGLRGRLILRRPVVRADVAEAARQAVVGGGEAVVDQEALARHGEDREVRLAELEAVVEASLPPRVVVVAADDRAVVRVDPAVGVEIRDANLARAAAAGRAGERRVGHLPEADVLVVVVDVDRLTDPPEAADVRGEAALQADDLVLVG